MLTYAGIGFTVRKKVEREFNRNVVVGKYLKAIMGAVKT